VIFFIKSFFGVFMKYEYQLTLRLSTDIAEALRNRANLSKRSLTAEITNILKQTVERDKEENTETKLRAIIANAESVLSSLK
jgi:hypothetical protein